MPCALAAFDLPGAHVMSRPCRLKPVARRPVAFGGRARRRHLPEQVAAICCEKMRPRASPIPPLLSSSFVSASKISAPASSSALRASAPVATTSSPNCCTFRVFSLTEGGFGKKSDAAISTSGDGRESSGVARGEHCACLPHLRGQRDLLSLQRQAERRERADRRSPDRLTRAKNTWGFGLCFLYLRNVRGHRWNHKRVIPHLPRVGVEPQIKPRKRLKRDKPAALTVPDAPNLVWSMDFMADRLEDCRQFRLLNVLNDFNRGGLGIQVDFSLPAERVIRSLTQIIEWRGKPFSIRVDNGPEYVSGKLMEWAETQGIALSHIQPGKPQQNAYVERYNRTVRHEWLDQYIMKASTRRRNSPHRGYGPTTTNGPIWESAASHPHRN